MDLQEFLQLPDDEKYARFQELERAAYTDRLTGCKNRNYFIDNRSKIETSEASAVIIDIDHFKKVNDTLGHEAGDKVLAKVARVIMGVVRCTDTIRYGGEEFLVCLKGVSISDACKIAERVRTTVETKTDVTVSIGVGSDLSSADKAVYQAKATGRNRVCTH